MEEGYDALIAEAFIDPIRSVLIVDDDYPTMHEILLEPDEQEKKFAHKDWRRDRQKVQKVIEEFRRPTSPYLLDVHDGTSPSEETDERQVHTLHQTDLLILDYQLDKSKEGDGSKAIRIAREALANKHFNLILVHTQEDLERVFDNFVIGLNVPRFANEQIHLSQDLQAFLDKWEDALLKAVGDPQYRWTTARKNTCDRALKGAVQKGSAPWGEVKDLLSRELQNRTEWLNAVKHALQVFEENQKERFSDTDLGAAYWGDGQVKFIRAARGFIAFKSKNDGEELLPAVRRALKEWNPRPPRLMLTKLRAEMNERGIEVQDDALGDPDVGAMWYRRVLEADEQNLDWIVNSTVKNHAEQLLDRLLPNVSEFAKRIRAADGQRTPSEAIKHHFGVDLDDPSILTRAKMGHNAFVGSKSARGPHLDLGHILKIADEYWLCLTPACDMVPRVHRGHPADRMDGIKRFTALKLVKKSEKEALLNANRGGHVFVNLLDTDGSSKRLAFAAAEKLGASPAWMIMYLGNDGFLPQNVDLQVCTVSFVSPSTSEVPKTLEMKHAEALVCGMLRYEYALEVQSKFITSQSRIGLDFVSDENGVDMGDGAAN